MPQSSDGLTHAAVTHLRLLADHHDRLRREDRQYVRLAFQYGIEVDEIAAYSRLDVGYVRSILGGA